MSFLRGYLFFLWTLLCAKKPEKKKRQWPCRWILGHRGARDVAAENTLTSLRLAMEHGACGVEFDVFLSKDSVPVLIHDETLERTTNGRGRVGDFLAAELKELNAAIIFAGAKIEGIPSLADALAILPDLAIVNIELKGAGHFSKVIFVEKIIAEIKKHQDRLCLIVSSFDGELLALFRKRAPEVFIGFLLSPRDRHWPSSLKYWKNTRPDALHIPEILATPLVRMLAKRAGIGIAIWTVNDVDKARVLFQKNIDGIFTDRVKEIVSGLDPMLKKNPF